MSTTKAFRFDKDDLASLERLARERDLSQTDVIRWALKQAVEAHEREAEAKQLDAILAQRTYDLLAEDLGENLPRGSWTWHDSPDDDDEIMIQVGSIGFVLEDAGPPRRWYALRPGEPEYEAGVVEDGEIAWTGRRES